MSTKSSKSAVKPKAGVARSKKSCNLKDDCRRIGCFNWHEGGELCPSYPQPCTDAAGCHGRHPSTDCYYGDACTAARCLLSHPSGRLCPFFPATCEAAESCASRHPPTKEREERPDCKYGDACTVKQCAYKHPGGPICQAFPAPCAVGVSKEVEDEKHPCALRHPASSTTNKLNQSTVRDASPTKPVAAGVREKPKGWLKQLVSNAINHHEKATKIEEERLQKLEETMYQHVDVDLVDLETQKAMRSRIAEMRKQLDVFRRVVARIPARRDLTDKKQEHLTKREIFRLRNRLPALGKRLEIENCLKTSKFTIVQGQTGSGKSTQIPQYAADMECFAGKRVLCTQPRKLAATSLATRVAFEYSGGYKDIKVGRDVGFRVGGYHKYGSQTRIEFVTEGILLDMIIKARAIKSGDKNPFSDVGCVIVDEAHERSITCDLIMGSFKESHPNWQNVKVVVTSATIDLAMFSGFYDNAPVVEIEGRMFPVDVNYVSSGRDGLLDTNRVVTAVAECALTIHQHCPDPAEGDILCFLPGQDDVLRAKQHFEKIVNRGAGQTGAIANQSRVVAYALYGKQDPQEQGEVLEKHKGPPSERKRKVIFSTNIAETSVTIDGVVFVVDSGLMKGMMYDPVRNISSLKVHAISRSSAIQRMGRAGRTQPGKCFRLYSQKDYNEMEIGSVAEIFRQPLALAMLTLHHLGIEPRRFPWIQSPNDDAMALAEEELTYLGALDANKQLTALGKLIADVQLDPKIVRMIDSGARAGVGSVATDLAAVMSVAHIFFWRGGSDKKSKTEAAAKKSQFLIASDGDIASMYRVFCDWKTIMETGVTPKTEGSDNRFVSSGSGSAGEDDDDDPDETMPSAFGAVLKATIEHENKNLDLWKKEADDNNDDTTSVAELSFGGGDDDDDTSSQCSEEPSPVKLRSTMKVKNVFERKRISAKWCMQNSLNGKALGIAYATSKELRATFRKMPCWQSNEKDPETVDGETIRRLITAGFFMNAARMKPKRRYGAPQYYALYSSVLGSIFSGSALNQDRKSKTDNEDVDPPQWILFDSILRLTSTTYLSLGTPIKEEWIQQESAAFGALCTEKSQDLPVEAVEWTNLSFEVFRGVFGKGYSKLSKLEATLKCNLVLDPDLGKVTAFCAPRVKSNVHMMFDNLITQEQVKLEKGMLEEVYMGDTRVVLGKGFVVSELLFAKEFSTLYVKNLAQRSEAELHQRIEQLRKKSAGTTSKQTPAVRSIEMTTHVDGKTSATIRFTTKAMAKEVYDLMRGELNKEGEALDVSPGLSDRSHKDGLKQDFAGRIKLSWADGTSRQEGKVFFPSAAAANNFITNCCNIRTLETLTLAAVGVLPRRASQDASAMMAIGRKVQPKTTVSPPLKRIQHPSLVNEFVYVFDVDEIASMEATKRVKLEFGVKIKSGLPVSMDEMELLDLIRPIPVLYAKITRKAAKANTATTTNQGVMEVRFMRMLPLLSFLDNSAVQSDFIDVQSCRAGVVVSFDDLRQLETAYLSASESDLWDKDDKPYGQPVRMEVEYIYSTSMHSELHRCFKTQIAEVITYAREKGIISEEVPSKYANSSSKSMVNLKFCGTSLALLARVRERLQACLECEKVKGDNVDLLFSYTGRAQAQQVQDASQFTVARQTYVRWIHKTREFWVYGEAESRRQATEKLSKLSAELGSLDVLDKLVRLDRFKVAALGNASAKPGAKKANYEATRAALLEIILGCSEKPYYYNITNNDRILLSGTNAAVNEVTKRLKQDGLLLKMRQRTSSDKPTCPVCFCEVDDPYITMSFCNHAYCAACFEQQLKSSGPPVACSDCQGLVHVNDVVRNGDSDTVSTLIENAIFKYTPGHKDICMICPRPGCNQILSTYCGILEGKQGGRFIFCDCCLHYYCIDCSEKAGRCIDRHDDESCEDVQSGGLSKVAQHVQHIQEKILNLWCPNCETPFLDFSGCTSVECGNPSCGHYFCANCLVYSTPSSGDTHSHVQRCDKNPSPATSGIKSYFVCEKALGEVHRVMRTEKLADYFRTAIQSERLRYHVFTRVAKDLHDLHIELPKSLRGKSSGDDRLVPHVNKIREDMLNLKCPACNLVFVDFDFDSCAALTCANPSCNCGFCAYCLADCQQDAHAHLRTCQLNPNRPYYYVTQAEFTGIQKRRREEAITEYLRGVAKEDNEVACGVWKEIQDDLRHLELEVASP